MTHGGTLLGAYYNALHLEQLPPDDEVWYWADSQVTLYSQTDVVSHSFADGRGVLKFGEPVSTMTQALRGTAIKRASLPNAMTIVGAHSFRSCQYLSVVRFPPTLLRIGDSAFYGCKNLMVDSLPSSLQRLENSAFRECSKAAVSSIPSSVVFIGNSSFNGNAMERITFNGTPTSISASAFSDCAELADIYVPWSSTDSINANAPWGATSATIHYNYTA